MANRKYDYSDELSPSAEPASETAKTSETEETPLVSAEEMRRQRLERRNGTLANEFHNLKPEIADAHKQQQDLINGIGAYAGTMQNLRDLLKSSFPIRFTDTDRQCRKNFMPLQTMRSRIFGMSTKKQTGIFTAMTAAFP